MLRGKEHIKLMRYTDSDWANDPDQCHSISGYLFTLGGGTISWSSKKKKNIAALCKGKYMVAGHCTRSIVAEMPNCLLAGSLTGTNNTAL